jgi:hypothetical protein
VAHGAGIVVVAVVAGEAEETRPRGVPEHQALDAPAHPVVVVGAGRGVKVPGRGGRREDVIHPIVGGEGGPSGGPRAIPAGAVLEQEHGPAAGVGALIVQVRAAGVLAAVARRFGGAAVVRVLPERGGWQAAKPGLSREAGAVVLLRRVRVAVQVERRGGGPVGGCRGR